MKNIGRKTREEIKIGDKFGMLKVISECEPRIYKGWKNINSGFVNVNVEMLRKF